MLNDPVGYVNQVYGRWFQGTGDRYGTLRNTGAVGANPIATGANDPVIIQEGCAKLSAMVATIPNTQLHEFDKGLVLSNLRVAGTILEAAATEIRGFNR